MSGERRDRFTFFASYFDAINDLNEEDQLAMFKAICRYGLSGEMPDLEGVSSTIFKLILPVLETGRKRSKSGKTGGSKSKKESKEETKGKQKESKKVAKEKQSASDMEQEQEQEQDKDVEVYQDAHARNDDTHDTHHTQSRPSFEMVSAEIYLQRYDIDDDSAEEFMRYNDRLEWRMDWREALAKWNEQEARRKADAKKSVGQKKTYSPMMERKDTNLDDVQRQLARAARKQTVGSG